MACCGLLTAASRFRQASLNYSVGQPIRGPDTRPVDASEDSRLHDLAAERPVLAVLLLDPGRIADVAAALAVRPGNLVSCSVKD